MTMWLEDEGLDCHYLIHDRDTKFTESFDALLKGLDVGIVKTPYVSPIANCFAESWIGTLKRECLNHFLCFSLNHLDHIVQIYMNYYKDLRPHRSLGNWPLNQVGQSPLTSMAGEFGPVCRQQFLGGLYSDYERKAA